MAGLRTHPDPQQCTSLGFSFLIKLLLLFVQTKMVAVSCCLASLPSGRQPRSWTLKTTMIECLTKPQTRASGQTKPQTRASGQTKPQTRASRMTIDQCPGAYTLHTQSQLLIGSKETVFNLTYY